MPKRIDEASRFIPVRPSVVYQAFSNPAILENWLPPENMTGTILNFDFREGGSYRMRLAYNNSGEGKGKTSNDMDEVEVRFIKLTTNKKILQTVTFKSDDPDFSGVMKMTRMLNTDKKGTFITIRAEDVPRGIQKEDHIDGMNSTLNNLALYLTGQNK